MYETPGDEIEYFICNTYNKNLTAFNKNNTKLESVSLANQTIDKYKCNQRINKGNELFENFKFIYNNLPLEKQKPISVTPKIEDT